MDTVYQPQLKKAVAAALPTIYADLQHDTSSRWAS